MMLIGIDTSVLIALLAQKDVWHSHAMALQTEMRERHLNPVMFDCVLAETISTLARRLHEKRRRGNLDLLLTTLREGYPSDEVEWLFPEVPMRYAEVIDLIRSSEGELNFNDALIALACRDRAIPLLASFDHDFDAVPWLRRIATPTDLA